MFSLHISFLRMKYNSLNKYHLKGLFSKSNDQLHIKIISQKYMFYKANLKSIKDYWVNNPCEEWFFGPGINCKNIDQIDLKQFKLNSFII